MSSTVISYPIPAYQNLPIEPQFYEPSRFVISNINRGITTTVTTTANMNYVIGQLVRFIIPPSFGIRQLNEMQGYVIALPAANQVEVDINSSFMDAYTISSAPTQSQILAIGNINSGTTNNSGRSQNITYIPGSFINISPQ